MKDYIAILKPEFTYHVYNRTIGKEKLFRNEENYNYFLRQYDKYISPFAETFSYCLLPNHFHFLIRCNDNKTVSNLYLDTFTNSVKKELFLKMNIAEKEKILSNHISRQFSHLFNGYTQAYNKKFVRHGALFSRPFKRIEITNEEYLRKLVLYIHHNPIEGGLCKGHSEWKWSSYRLITQQEETFVNKNEVVEWFGNLDNFISIHKHYRH